MPSIRPATSAIGFLIVLTVLAHLVPARAQSTSQATVTWACLTTGATPSVFASVRRNADCTSGSAANSRAVPRLSGAAALSTPGAPTNLGPSVNGTTVVLTWAAASAGDPPLSYVIEAGSSSGRSDLANSDLGSSATMLTVTAVPSGTYYVRLRARTAAGISPPSAEIVVTVGSRTGTILRYTGLAVGSVDMGSLGVILMSDVVMLADGRYRLHFRRTLGPGRDSIAYAESTDAQTWTFYGDLLRGSSDPASSSYELTGPRVVALTGGRYRLYFDGSPYYAPSAHPPIRVFSAVSSNGLDYTPEAGTRINISPDDPASPFSLAGHGAFYQIDDGSYVGVISADPIGSNGPSNLYIGRSADGLTWGNFTLLYSQFHDPVVIRSGGTFYMVAKLLATSMYAATSTDGVNWPAASQLTPLTFLDQSGADVTARIGDVGALIAPDGQVRILSNWSAQAGPSTALAMFALSR